MLFFFLGNINIIITDSIDHNFETKQIRVYDYYLHVHELRMIHIIYAIDVIDDKNNEKTLHVMSIFYHHEMPKFYM